jgi:hypothetical protein
VSDLFSRTHAKKGGSMKRARRHNRIYTRSLATALLLAVCYGAFRCAHAVIAHAPLTIMHGPLLAEVCQAELETNLTNAVHAHGPAYAVAQPASYSPLLAAIQIRYKFPYHGIVRYDTIQPSAQLNNAAIALTSGALVPTTMLNAEACASLPAVQVPAEFLNEATTSETLKLFLNDMTPRVTERFSCEWQDKNVCYYRDSQHTHYTLVADGRTPISDSDVTLYDTVVQQFKPERAHKNWMVDIRFNGQVVVTPDGGL